MAVEKITVLWIVISVFRTTEPWRFASRLKSAWRALEENCRETLQIPQTRRKRVFCECERSKTSIHLFLPHPQMKNLQATFNIATLWQVSKDLIQIEEAWCKLFENNKLALTIKIHNLHQVSGFFCCVRTAQVYILTTLCNKDLVKKAIYNRMRWHGLRQLVEDKCVASCRQTCWKLIVKTCYPQVCCK